MIDPAQLKMPTVSRESVEVMRMLDSDDVDLPALVKAIGLDPVLSGTLIRYANSPLHRRARDATSVQQAVNVLGTRQVRAAAMVAAMRGFADGGGAVETMLWEQSVALSTLARTLAKRCCPRLADEAELLGLLQNMGALVLNTNFGDLYASLVDCLTTDGPRVHDAEREVFGLHRGALIGALAERFRLPPAITDVLLAFHAQQVPGEIVSDHERLLALLWLSQWIASRSPAGAHWPPEFLPPSITALAEQFGLDDEALLNLSEDVELLVAQRLTA